MCRLGQCEFATGGKLVFVALILAQDNRYLGSAALTVVVDTLFVAVFAAFLWAVRLPARQVT